MLLIASRSDTSPLSLCKWERESPQGLVYSGTDKRAPTISQRGLLAGSTFQGLDDLFRRPSTDRWVQFLFKR